MMTDSNYTVLNNPDMKARIQNWFNTAVKGLASQGFNRSIAGGECVFRGPDGMKCAIGHIVTDEQLKGIARERPNLEPTPSQVRCLLTKDPTEDHFLFKLMDAHDRGKEPKYVVNGLIRMAEYYGLELPPELTPETK